MLQIVVANHCAQCRDAIQLAKQLRQEFLRLDVRVLDLDVPGTIKPDAVFAVPSYLLNGRIVWLGNPEPAELYAMLQTAT